MPMINFTNPLTLLVVTLIYVLILILSKETKKSVIQYYLKGTEPSNNYNLDDAIPTIKYDE